MNEFTGHAANRAEDALATNPGPVRNVAIAEAHAFAAVSQAVDTAELLAIEKVTSMQHAMDVYDLAPAEALLDVSKLDPDIRDAINGILATTDPDSDTRVVLYDGREGSGWERQRLEAAATILGLDWETLGRLIGDPIAFPVKLADVLAELHPTPDDGGHAEEANDLDVFADAKREADAKAAKRAAKAERKAAAEKARERDEVWIEEES